jgi:NAD(P)-dependent dehydrogenase (short-subunit alcohol dehydrogenase family)
VNKNKVTIITGGSGGIGKAAAIKLAEEGGKIVIFSRNEEKVKRAVEDIVRKTGNNRIEYILCDLSSFKSIRRAAKEFKERNGRLDVLINNAGMNQLERKITEDGYEMQFQVNYLSQFLLTNLMLDLLIKSTPSRIINVSSAMHKYGKINFGDINFNRGYSKYKAYTQSKLAVIFFTESLSEKLADKGVSVNALHPGLVRTEIGINRENGNGKFIRRLKNPFAIPPEKGCETLVYLACSPEVEKITGKYFIRKKIKRTSNLSHDKEIADKLWQLSVDATGADIII